MSPGRLLPQLVLELAAGPGEVAPHAHPGHHLLAPQHAVLLPDLSWICCSSVAYDEVCSLVNSIKNASNQSLDFTFFQSLKST